MKKTLKGQCRDADQTRDTREELVAAGIPQDRVFVDEVDQVISVEITGEEEAEVMQIFGRHDVEPL
ncbi:hypothetical protein [Marinobacter sp.]|uniref:hypothetical protein n=1 Tax=Marinobacter sp. TaxID=50741 RepID=UPI0038515700